MTSVCFVTDPADDPRQALFRYETARQALSTYDPTLWYDNALVVEPVSLGSAISLVRDLEWYLRRCVRETIIREPSVSDEEWLSITLAQALRAEEIDPEETRSLVKIYGVDAGCLVEPMYAERREDGTLPAYDLRAVDETVIVRITAEAFGG